MIQSPPVMLLRIPRVSGGNSVAAKIFEDETGIPRVSGGNSVFSRAAYEAGSIPRVSGGNSKIVHELLKNETVFPA